MKKAPSEAESAPLGVWEVRRYGPVGLGPVPFG